MVAIDPVLEQQFHDQDFDRALTMMWENGWTPSQWFAMRGTMKSRRDQRILFALVRLHGSREAA